MTSLSPSSPVAKCVLHPTRPFGPLSPLTWDCTPFLLIFFSWLLYYCPIPTLHLPLCPFLRLLCGVPFLCFLSSQLETLCLGDQAIDFHSPGYCLNVGDCPVSICDHSHLRRLHPASPTAQWASPKGIANPLCQKLSPSTYSKPAPFLLLPSSESGPPSAQPEPPWLLHLLHPSDPFTKFAFAAASQPPLCSLHVSLPFCLDCCNNFLIFSPSLVEIKFTCKSGEF